MSGAARARPKARAAVRPLTDALAKRFRADGVETRRYQTRVSIVKTPFADSPVPPSLVE
jgi:hypothetical protein